VKAILPPDGQGIAVTSGTFTQRGQGMPEVLVMIEIDGGPIITLTPQQWSTLVNRIRGARTSRELGA
jgi:hypothetical protein